MDARMMRFDHRDHRGETASGGDGVRMPTRPEDIVHRGVGLPTACVSGDLPLVAMLLAEGAESGIDMLAADAVRVASRAGWFLISRSLKKIDFRTQDRKKRSVVADCRSGYCCCVHTRMVRARLRALCEARVSLIWPDRWPSRFRFSSRKLWR